MFNVRISATSPVNQGDQAGRMISANATKMDDENILGIFKPFLQRTPKAADEFLIKGISNSEKPCGMSPGKTLPGTVRQDRCAPHVIYLANHAGE